MVLRSLAVLAVLAAWQCSYGVGASPDDITWWAADAMQKVRPETPRADSVSGVVRLEAARNEFEPFQIVLLSQSKDIDGVDVSVSDLKGPGNSSITAHNITPYLEQYIRLQKASSVEGAAGEWPDPLIPRVDRYMGEHRNAFPFRLLKGRNQPLWFDVYVPRSTPAGEYTGNIAVTLGKEPRISVPVRLVVWDFDLPSTSSLRTAFGFSGVTALKKHKGGYTSDADLFRITSLYTKAALLHRISTCGGTMVPPRAIRTGDSIKVDWSQYDRVEGPFLDGTVLRDDDPLPGARVTSIDARTWGESDEDKVLYWREWVRHFKERGWADRLYLYVWDEPTADLIPRVGAKARLARQADPGLKNLVTASFDERIADAIDIWTPLINCIDNKPGFPDYCAQTVPRSRYDAVLGQGRALWWYQSCSSHGCSGGGTNEYFRGWPTYTIDSEAMANRVMPWLTWTYGISGNLYYAMNESYAHADNPWEQVYLHGGNGDGTLFYPGRPERIGGTSDIPIESIRLKLIREGLEDYEYLAALARIDKQSAYDSAARIGRKVYAWEHNPSVLYEVRRSIAQKLTRSRQASNRAR